MGNVLLTAMRVTESDARPLRAQAASIRDEIA
jgi:hypothetical protein